MSISTDSDQSGSWISTPVDSDVTKAAEFATQQIGLSEAITITLDHVVSAKKQIVSGTNYDLVLQMDNSDQWHVIISQDLDNNYEMTLKEQVK